VFGSPKLLARTIARGAVCLTLSGCMALVPQLEPTDLAQIEQASSRSERDQLRRDNSIYRHEEPQGTRYTKGNDDSTPKRSWQSLDAILRSDANSSAALPAKQLRRSRVFTALAVASSMLFVAGIATTARDGFDFKHPSPENGVLLGGALSSVAFAVLAGVFFRRARKGYDQAVDIYNDSLGLRLGVMTAQGTYVPPSDIEVDADGYVVTEDRLAPGSEGPRPIIQPPPTAPALAPPPATPIAPPAPAPAPATEVQPVPTPPPPVVPPPHARRPQAAPQLYTPLLAAPRPVGALTLLPPR
jgi:hypothetical protein